MGSATHGLLAALALLVPGGPAGQAPAAAPAAQNADCAPERGISFICVDRPEDLVGVPGTDWVLASALGGRGGISLINARDRSVRQLYPFPAGADRFDRQTYRACPGPPQGEHRAKFNTHGLSLRPIGRGTYRLYAVHHGVRESVEIFTLDARGAEPTLAWNGCVPAPGKMWFNSVAGLPDGGFVVTNFHTGGPLPIDRFLAMSPDSVTGEAWEWHRRSGWRKLPGTEAAGPNGVEVSPDGRWLYMNSWMGRAFLRIARDRQAPRRDVVPLGFLADNIRRGPGGTLYVAGQDKDRTHVVEIDPATLKVTRRVEWLDTPAFRFGTGVLPVGKDVWVAGVLSNRIAIFPGK